MRTRDLIDHEVGMLPESLQQEAYDFVKFLKHKSDDDSFDGLAYSESAISKDWYTPEDDAAWENL